MKPPYYLTAYGIALKHGFKGTEEEWLNSLTAFYLAQQAGYTGTADEWLRILNDPVPNIEIGEVTTLDGGSNAVVTITGDKHHAILNFGIPRGMGMVDALPLVGGIMRGKIDMGTYGITNLAEPMNPQDAVTKAYVENENDKIKTYVNDENAKIKTYVNDENAKIKTHVNEKYASTTVLLPVSGWDNKSQTVSVPGVTEDVAQTDVYAAANPEEENYAAYAESGVRLYAQLEGKCVFKCEKTPELDLIVNLSIRKLGVAP